MHVDDEAGLSQELRRHHRKLGENDDVGRLQQDDGCAGIARFLEQLPGARGVLLGNEVHALRRGVPRPAGIDRKTRAIQAGNADLHLQEHFLIERRHRRPAHLRVVEGWFEVIEPQVILPAERIELEQLDVRIALQRPVQLEGGHFKHIDLAGRERIRLRLRIRDDEPLDAVHARDLSARPFRWRDRRGAYSACF